MGKLLTGYLLPKHLARLTVQAYDGELIQFRRLRAPAEAASALSSARSLAGRGAVAFGRGGLWLFDRIGGLCFDLLTGGDCALDEDPVLPNDGRGLPAAGNLDLPLNVIRLAPSGGWIGRRRHAA